MTSSLRIKANLRRKVWELMESSGIATFPRPVYGRVPNFKGAHLAAERITRFERFKESKIIKVDPDSPLRPIREVALKTGKTLVMPTPRIKRGFIVLEADKVRSPSSASTIRGAFAQGRIVEDPYDLPRVDLMIVGCVAVSAVNGIRIGKGSGYSDLEYAILVESRRCSRDVPIVAVAHDVQVFNEPFPQDPYDAPVDYIVTPTRTLRVNSRGPRPEGLLVERLNADLLSLPILRVLLRDKGFNT